MSEKTVVGEMKVHMKLLIVGNGLVFENSAFVHHIFLVCRDITNVRLISSRLRGELKILD